MLSDSACTKPHTPAQVKTRTEQELIRGFWNRHVRQSGATGRLNVSHHTLAIP